MFFDEDFIATVEDDPIAGIVNAIRMAQDHLEFLDNGEEWTEEEHELLWEVGSFIQLVIEVNQLKCDQALPEVMGSIEDNCSRLQGYLKVINDHFKPIYINQTVIRKAEMYKNRYKHAMRGSFAYEFSKGDLERIQLLLNELRTEISDNKFLEESHKLRLLKKLEHLQSELHKRVSDLDRFWGMVGDAGVVLGKLGQDAKPIVDRIREIAEIVWKTQARTEELSSDSPYPMLDNVEND